MTKTIFILTSEPPERGGGVEHFVRETVKGLEARGFKTEVFHRGNSEPSWLARGKGRLTKKVAGTLCGYWIGRNAQKHMGDHVAAVISNSDVGYYPLRSRSPIRRIHFYHGTYRAQSEAIRPFINYGGYLYLKWWNAMVLERFSGSGKTVLTCSDQVREEVAEFFGHRAIAIWCPLDLDRFKPCDVVEARRKLNLPEGMPIGLFVGSTQPTKGFPMVRKLVDAVPEVYWILALRGDLPSEMPPQQNLRVLQNASHDQISTLYNAASFSLCPSLYEGFGYVVAESLSCGTPVIASPGGASRLFLKDQPFSQFLIEDPNDFSSFRHAVSQVLSDPQKWRDLIQTRVRPRLEEMMAPENWWKRFERVVGI
jgi:glycosyltransferase involved in cell wall biosynthesis